MFVGGGGRTYDPLPDGGPHPVTIREFDERALDAGEVSFAGRTVELTGFVARPEDGDGFRLARFQISCCAADAVAAVLRVIDPGSAAPARDSWLTVTGEFRGVGPDGIPELDAASMQPREVPVDPYE
ncbi:MAG: TIGR03943 family putative permease subunit [Pseudonocardiales bacterium]